MGFAVLEGSTPYLCPFSPKKIFKELFCQIVLEKSSALTISSH